MSAHTHSYQVPGFKPILNQLALNPPRPFGCWATVYTMMVSWKLQQSFDIREALGRVGAVYQEMFDIDSGLSQADAVTFLRAAGMHYEPMANQDVKGWFHLLKQYGLLWVSARSETSHATHSRIVEGIRIDDLVHGHMVSLMIIDPWGGRRYLELFTTFLNKYEGARQDHKGMYFQIRHF